MTKWEADYPLYYKLKAGPIEATVTADWQGSHATIVGNINIGAPDHFVSSDDAKDWCKDELRKIRDKINEALDE